MPLIDDNPYLPSPDKPKLLDPVSFAALLRIQKDIAQETGWQPSVNKLASALVTPENLEHLKARLLTEFKQRIGDEQNRIEKNP